MIPDIYLSDKEIQRAIQDAWGDLDACPNTDYLEPGDKAVAKAAADNAAKIVVEWLEIKLSPKQSLKIFDFEALACRTLGESDWQTLKKLDKID